MKQIPTLSDAGLLRADGIGYTKSATLRCDECLLPAWGGLYEFPKRCLCQYCLEDAKVYTDEETHCSVCGDEIDCSGYEVDGEIYCSDCVDALREGHRWKS